MLPHKSRPPLLSTLGQPVLQGYHSEPCYWSQCCPFFFLKTFVPITNFQQYPSPPWLQLFTYWHWAKYLFLPWGERQRQHSNWENSTDSNVILELVSASPFLLTLLFRWPWHGISSQILLHVRPPSTEKPLYLAAHSPFPFSPSPTALHWELWVWYFLYLGWTVHPLRKWSCCISSFSTPSALHSDYLFTTDIEWISVRY